MHVLVVCLSLSDRPYVRYFLLRELVIAALFLQIAAARPAAHLILLAFLGTLKLGIHFRLAAHVDLPDKPRDIGSRRAFARHLLRDLGNAALLYGV